MSDGYQQILEAAAPDVQKLVERAKAMILEIMSEAVEAAWPRQNIVSYGVGPKKMSEHFCYIAVLKDRINLGFYYGADLADPENLLTGTGQMMRHTKINSLEDLENPALFKLVDQASGYLPKLNA